MKFLTVFALLLALAVPTVQAESRDREKPIEIQADHFFGDELKQVATYTGSVRVDQGTMRLTGQKLDEIPKQRELRNGSLARLSKSFMRNVPALLPLQARHWLNDPKTESLRIVQGGIKSSTIQSAHVQLSKVAKAGEPVPL